MLPILILALGISLFGIENANRFSFVALYALFASPLLLMPLLSANLNQSFANANTLIVYNLLKAILPSLVYSTPISLIMNGNMISIGQACVGVGALIGIVMFMLPLIYLYDGRAIDKAIWIFSGFVLLLALNLLRMTGISLLWFIYGASTALLSLHAVVGQIIFYGTFVLMVLLAGRFGLIFPEINAKHVQMRWPVAGIVVALFVAAAAFGGMNASYPTGTTLSPLLIESSANVTFTYMSLATLFANNTLAGNYTTQAVISNDNKSAAVYIYNVSNYTSQPITVLFGAQNDTLQDEIANGSSAYVIGEAPGLSRAYIVGASSQPSFIFYRRIPYSMNGYYESVAMYVVVPYYPYWQDPSCQPLNKKLYNDVANLVLFNLPNETYTDKAYSAYCFVSKVVKP
ncbi:MAG: archaeosortase/exosortase family protein, partial [Candidatus Micrarchaeota archaeon]|nr:archaeosortase/exosortase family protein [Candidatus Micrarchaeota archaeon]